MTFLSSTEVWELSPDGLLVVEADGTIRAVNAALADMVGRSQASLVGQPVELLLAPHRRESHVALRDGYFLEPASRAMGNTRHLEALRADGSVLPVTVTLTPLSIDGSTSVFVAVRDLSERVKNDRALAAANRRRAQAEDADRIATELHDNVVQRLFVLGLDLQQLGSIVETSIAHDRLSAAVDTIDDTIREIRNTIFDLTAPRAPSISLRDEVHEVVARLETAHGLTSSVSFEGEIDAIDAVTYGFPVRRVLQRTLDLVATESAANEVAVTVEVGEVLAVAIESPSPTAPSTDLIAELHSVRSTNIPAALELEHADDTTRVIWSVSLDLG